MNPSFLLLSAKFPNTFGNCKTEKKNAIKPLMGGHIEFRKKPIDLEMTNF